MNSDRTTAAGERTRERILEAALPLFAEHGYAGTSVRKVAGAAEVNVATLAYHFRDKAGLYAATLERLYERLVDLPVQMATKDGDDVMSSLVRTAWTYLKDNKRHMRLLHRNLLDHGRHHDAALADWTAPLFDRVRIITQYNPDLDEGTFKLVVLTGVHLLVRLCLEDPGQLALQLGIEADDVDEAVIRWVRDVLAARLGMPVLG